MKSAKVTAVVMMVAALSVLLIIPGTPSEAGVANGDVGLIPYDDAFEVNAGSSSEFTIEVVNHLPFIADDIANSRMITVYAEDHDKADIRIEKDNNNFVLAGQEHRQIKITVEVDKYASAGDHEITIALTVRTLDADPAFVTESTDIEMIVLSPLSSDATYNKILGLFDNPLPEPFNGPTATALITFAIWMLIGLALMFLIVTILPSFLVHDNKEDIKKIKRGLSTLIPFVVFLFATNSALRVYGAAEELIGPVEMWFNLCYIALGAIIVWRVYLITVQHLLAKIAKSQRIDQKEMDIEPLFRLIGKLIIWVFSIASIMSVLGFDLTAIITSAGLISLGITFGAQSILSQFFSGMSLLMSRPFKTGDLVRIEDSGIYRVARVNIMNTVFENWDNKETVIMPNNTVASSVIVNLTGEGLIYKISVTVGIGYNDDLDKAKELMVKAATGHPNVITNGSVDLPYTRLTAFLDSSIELRLTSYVYDFNDSGKIGGELREAIFKAFSENGISIPFPQREVHVNIVKKDDPIDE